MSNAAADSVARVKHLFIKRERGKPMVEVPSLDVERADVGDGETAFGFSPRQLCIAESESLDRNGVKASGARADIVIEGADLSLASGSLLAIGQVNLRLTLACEPCAHGAQLAQAPMPMFRQIRRFLGLVTAPGVVAVGAGARVHPEVWEECPDNFRDRCAWAVERIPAGRVTTSVELLSAIGAGRSYSRVLPRWMQLARDQGAAVHRVLAANLGAPSWAPDAADRLLGEGVRQEDYARVNYPLSRAIWRDGQGGRVDA
ncbi:hypothetical protein [Micromonospora sp. NPDC004704]